MTVIDDLCAKIAPTQRTELERIRQKVHEVCPGAEEVKTYGMPGFKYKGKYLLSFATFKDHMSLFPGAEPTAALEARLMEYKHSKGAIQFTSDKPLSDDLLTELVLLCKQRNEG